MFEIGDLIKIRDDAPKINWNEKMDEYIGRNMTVREVSENGVRARGNTWFWNNENIEKVGHAEMFDRKRFLELMKESKKKVAEYLMSANLSGADLRRADLRRADLSDANLSDANLSGADLSDADLSGSQGLLDAINYLEAHFERTEEGYIVYKTFGSYNTPSEHWKIEEGSILEETVNPNRTNTCGCGINVGTFDWVNRDNCGKRKMYKLLIKFEWLAGVVVPFGTDGKIRCSRAQILGVVAE